MSSEAVPESEIDSADVDVDSVLRQPLTKEQYELLYLLWKPIEQHEQLGCQPDWPWWDYAERELYRKVPDLADAAAVLASLPQIGSSPGMTKPYGLVWVENSTQEHPFTHSPVGLTIAGVWQLAHAGLIHPALPDQFVEALTAIATWDAGIQPKPHAYVSESRSLGQFMPALTQKVHDRPYSVSDGATARLLAHEYVPVNTHVAQHQAAVVTFGNRNLRAYRGLGTADQYLDLVERTDAAQRASYHHSPMPLVQTMDYLGYVLKADPSWHADRLTTAPDLQAASALTAKVTDADQFQLALTGLCTIIDQFKVPNLPDDVVKAHDEGKQPATINRLQCWLETRLAGTAGADHVRTAVKVLRLVKDLRTEAQHSSVTTRTKARAARIGLGLPDPVFDWATAWAIVQDRVAGALDTIRVEVAAAQHSGK